MPFNSIRTRKDSKLLQIFSIAFRASCLTYIICWQPVDKNNQASLRLMAYLVIYEAVCHTLDGVCIHSIDASHHLRIWNATTMHQELQVTKRNAVMFPFQMRDQEPWDGSVTEERQSLCLHAGRAPKPLQDRRISHVLLAGAVQQLKPPHRRSAAHIRRSCALKNRAAHQLLDPSVNRATINEEREKSGVHEL
jgi:hypothetical protein